MVREIMDGIREVEIEAQHIIDNAKEESKEIIARARNDGEKIRFEIIESANLEAKKKMDLAISEGKAKSDKAVSIIDNDALGIKELSRDKENEIIDEILRALI